MFCLVSTLFKNIKLIVKIKTGRFATLEPLWLYHGVCISQGSPEQKNQDTVYIHGERLILRNLHAFVEGDQSKICKVSPLAGEPGKSWFCCHESEDPEFLLPQGKLFLSLKAFNWLDELPPHPYYEE